MTHYAYMSGLAALLSTITASAQAQLSVEQLKISVPVRYDTVLGMDNGETLKNRIQYQFGLRYGFGLYRFAPDIRLSLRGLLGTGGSYTSQWNTAYDIKDALFDDQLLNMRQIYLEQDLHHWRLQVGIIPPVKGKVSNTSLDKDGWIRGARLVTPLQNEGRLELVTGAIDHLQSPNAFQLWEEWNYAEVEWSQPWHVGWLTEAGYMRLDQENYLRAEVRRTWRFSEQLPLELAAELLHNWSASNWAYDVSAQVKSTFFTAVVEYSYVPQTFGLLGQLSNDFFTLGHLGMLAFKGPVAALEHLGWFAKLYVNDELVRVNLGLALKYAL